MKREYREKELCSYEREAKRKRGGLIGFGVLSVILGVVMLPLPFFFLLLIVVGAGVSVGFGGVSMDVQYGRFLLFEAGGVCLSGIFLLVSGISSIIASGKTVPAVVPVIIGTAGIGWIFLIDLIFFFCIFSKTLPWDYFLIILFALGTAISVAEAVFVKKLYALTFKLCFGSPSAG